MNAKREQLRAALQSIQMHAAGMHAAADLAMRLVAESDGREGMMDRLRRERSAGPAHYGDPGADVEALIEEVERAGGTPPTTAQGGADTTPIRE